MVIRLLGYTDIPHNRKNPPPHNPTRHSPPSGTVGAVSTYRRLRSPRSLHRRLSGVCPLRGQDRLLCTIQKVCGWTVSCRAASHARLGEIIVKRRAAVIRRGAEMRNFACVWIKGKKSTMATSGFLWRASVRSARAFCLVVLSAVVLSGAAASSGARLSGGPVVPAAQRPVRERSARMRCA